MKEYYYICNAQGHIIGLFDSTGTQVVSYSYDSWGKLISTTGTIASTVGVKNPYLYRGYRFDSLGYNGAVINRIIDGAGQVTTLDLTPKGYPHWNY